MWLCRATLLATVILVCIGIPASVEMSVAVTVTFVSGLLPGAVFLGMRTRTLYPRRKLGLTLSEMVCEWIIDSVVRTDLRTMLLSRLARTSPFPFGTMAVLTSSRLFLIRA